MSDFKREFRYFVLKIKDIMASEHSEKILFHVGQIADLLPDRQYVVIEDDWPEYEIVWNMIKDRINGKECELDFLREQNVAIKNVLNECCEAFQINLSRWQHKDEVVMLNAMNKAKSVLKKKRK